MTEWARHSPSRNRNHKRRGALALRFDLSVSLKSIVGSLQSNFFIQIKPGELPSVGSTRIHGYFFPYLPPGKKAIEGRVKRCQKSKKGYSQEIRTGPIMSSPGKHFLFLFG